MPSGEAPSQRTCHSAAAIGNRLFIFGGGQSGAEAVKDDKLYVYNASKETEIIFCNQILAVVITRVVVYCLINYLLTQINRPFQYLCDVYLFDLGAKCFH